MPGSSRDKLESFEYLAPPPEFKPDMSYMYEESAWDKFKRKFNSQPLIPIGCVLTGGALSYGIYQMKTGNKVMSQRMMRLRIIAQGFTVVALLFGALHAAKSTSNNPSTN